MCRCLVGLAFAAMAMASAQTTPKIWLSGKGNNTFTGDLQPNRDPRFREAICYHMNWGLYYPVATNLSNRPPRTGAQTAARIAAEAQARGLSGADTMIFIPSFGLQGMELKLENGLYTQRYNYSTNANDPVPSPFPSLYNDPADTMSVTYSSTGTTRVERTPWTNTGITKMSVWMVDFLTNYDPLGTDRPKRLIFDQEIGIPIGGFRYWSDVREYWIQMKDHDARWSERTVPGFGTQKMKDLWDNRPSGVEDPLPQGNDPRYKGGSPENHRWYAWFCGIFYQVHAATMNGAVYAKVAAHWPGTLCGDYDSTLRLDGAIGEYGVPANTTLEGAHPGSLGDYGMRYVFEAPGSNIFQNPHFYSAANGYIWHGYKIGNTQSFNKWANTDDTHTPTYGLTNNGYGSPRGSASGNEFWWETSARMNRYFADAVVRSFPGQNKNTIGWVTIPNQPHLFPAAGLYDGITYNYYPAAREPLAATYRTLAMCRSRGIDELVVWNDTGRDVNVAYGGYNRGLHANYYKNWDMFRRAVDLVWAYNAKDFYVTANNQLPQGLSTTQLLNRIGMSDLNYSSLDDNTVRVTTSALNGIWAVTAFKNTAGVADPQFLNLEYEVRLNVNTPVYLYILDADTPGTAWLPIGQASAPDLDGRMYPVTSVADKTMRLRARIAFDPKYVDNTTGMIRVAMFTAPVGVSAVTPTAYFDLTQCYGSDEFIRKMGDFNGDCDVNGDDDNHFWAMHQRYLDDSVPDSQKALSYVQALDLNHDGVISAADLTLWTAVWDPLIAAELGYNRPNWRNEPVDDGRQMASDLRPRP